MPKKSAPAYSLEQIQETAEDLNAAVAAAEEFGGIDAVLSIKGDPPCLHGPLDGRTGDIAGTGSFREGKLGHGRSLCGAWVSDSLAMIRQAKGRKQGAASDNRLYVNEGSGTLF